MKIELVKYENICEIANLYLKVYTQFLPNENQTLENAKKFIEYNYKKQSDLFFVNIFLYLCLSDYSFF